MEIEVPDIEEGFQWDDGFEIFVKVDNDDVIIKANKAGLISLARHLLALANDKKLSNHFHLDEHNSLEDGSAELIIEKS